MPVPNLSTVEIKAFVPARDFALSKRFYEALGFTLASDGDGVAYFRHGDCSFLLQDSSADERVVHFAMHLLVEDVEAWHAHVRAQRIAERFGVAIGEPEDRPWAMRDFTLIDPGGVSWRIAQNIPRRA